MYYIRCEYVVLCIFWLSDLFLFQELIPLRMCFTELDDKAWLGLNLLTSEMRLFYVRCRFVVSLLTRRRSEAMVTFSVAA